MGHPRFGFGADLVGEVVSDLNLLERDGNSPMVHKKFMASALVSGWWGVSPPFALLMIDISKIQIVSRGLPKSLSVNEVATKSEIRSMAVSRYAGALRLTVTFVDGRRDWRIWLYNPKKFLESCAFYHYQVARRGAV